MTGVLERLALDAQVGHPGLHLLCVAHASELPRLAHASADSSRELVVCSVAAGLVELRSELGVIRQRFRGLVGCFPAEPKGPLDGDAQEAEALVGEDLHPGGVVAVGAFLLLIEVAVEAHDVGDLGVAHLLALLAEALAHLGEALPSIDQLDLALAVGRLAVADDPEVGGDAGVVEELIGQGHHRLEPVVLDDPPPDLGLAAPGGAGEERAAVEHDRQAAATVLGSLHLRDHVLEEQEAAVVDARQASAITTAEAE